MNGKICKSCLCLLLAILFFITPFTAFAAADVQQTAWYSEAAEYCMNHGIMTQDGNGLFYPQTTVTREMFLTVLYRVSGEAETGEVPFTDVPDTAWYADAVCWGSRNGIVKGVRENLFGVGQFITREQVCTVLVRYLTYKGYDLGKFSGELFADDSTVSAFAKESVYLAKMWGVVSGTGNNCFSPKAYLTRAEAAQLFYRLAKIDFSHLHTPAVRTEYVSATGGIRYRTVTYCTGCEEILEQGDYVNGRLPVLELTGDMDSVTKENTVTFTANYDGADQTFSAYCTVKWQGNSSLLYDKKNYNIKFFTDENLEKKQKIDFGWGKENKYTLKANYIDCTHAHNIVSARLWGDVVRSRGDDTIPMTQKVNGGAIDGFPVMLYVNNEYQGLYTLNIPKDKWSIETKQQPLGAMVSTGNWLAPSNFKALASSNDSSWEVEENELFDSDEEVIASVDNWIAFVMENSGTAFRDGIGQYMDVSSYIDYMCFCMIACMPDNVGKNCMFVTFDGVKWYTTLYDMDTSWGLTWTGKGFYDTNTMVPTVSGSERVINETENLLWQRMLESFAPEIKARYFTLRQTVLTNEKIMEKFYDFTDLIPSYLTMAETVLYPDLPGTSVNTLDAIAEFNEKHLSALDAAMNNFPDA